MNKHAGVLDDHWTEAVNFVLKHAKKRDRVFAPAALSAHLPRRVVGYNDTSSAPIDWEWAMIHKGQLSKLSLDLIIQIEADFIPAFANAVFVIFTTNLKIPVLDYSNTHLAAYRQQKKKIVTSSPSSRLSDDVKDIKKTLRMLTRKVERVEHRWNVYLGEQTALTKTVHGHLMIVPTQDLSVAKGLMLRGIWEDWVTQVFLDTIEPGMVVLDLGGNLGYYTVLAASLAGDTGHVYSFEVDTDLCNIIRHNVIMNGYQPNTTVVNKAVYSSNTTLQFDHRQYFKGAGSVHQKTSDSANKALQQAVFDTYNDTVETVEVEAIALDSYFPDDVTIDFMKMDVEGSEPHVFAGMKRLIEKQKNLKMVFEFYPSNFETENAARAFLLDVQSWGFSLQGIDKKLGIVDISIDQLMEGKIHDIFASKSC